MTSSGARRLLILLALIVLLAIAAVIVKYNSRIESLDKGLHDAGTGHN